MDGNEIESLAVASLRIDWLQEIVRRCQEFVGRLLPDRSHLDASAVEAFVQELPKPRGPGEVMVMKALLLDLAVSVQETAKGRLGAGLENRTRRRWHGPEYSRAGP